MEVKVEILVLWFLDLGKQIHGHTLWVKNVSIFWDGVQSAPDQLLRWFCLPRTLVTFSCSSCALALRQEQPLFMGPASHVRSFQRSSSPTLPFSVGSLPSSSHSFVFLPWEKIKVMGWFFIFLNPGPSPLPQFCLNGREDMRHQERQGLVSPKASFHACPKHLLWWAVQYSKLEI